MFVERLELAEFRSYESLSLEFGAPLGLIAGGNGQGKTNLLEAIALLAGGRSPRTARDGEMVRRGTPEAAVRGLVRRTQRESVALAVGIRADGAKTVKVGGLPRRLGELIGELTAVLFLPDDLALVSGAPERRRAFLNGALGQIDRRYLTALGRYRQALRQRNELLRTAEQRRLDEALLLVYDDQLAAEAAVLMAARVEFIAALGREAAAVHARLSGGERLRLEYQPSVPLPEATDEPALAAQVAEHLVAARSRELRRGITLVGPHRDELALELDGRSARQFASQGQQRTAALALKIAELRCLTAAAGEPPVLLLDDVLSELDAGRRREVMGLVDEAEQVLITASDAALFDRALLGGAERFEVTLGAVRREAPDG